MRIATSSLSREVLNRILHQHIDADDETQRRNIVRLYIESERYTDAEQELQKLIQDFPRANELGELLVELRQLKPGARRARRPGSRCRSR